MHELNNPLNNSAIALEMALEIHGTSIDPDLNDLLTDAQNGVLRAKNITLDLKTFAYQPPGEISRTFFRFEDALNSSLRLTGFELKGVIIEKELALETLVCGDLPGVIALLINLLSNAALALGNACRTPSSIRIKAWPEVDSNGRSLLNITIRDTGAGISPDNLKLIFDPFFTTRDVGQGLGLGLSIGYAVAMAHGGPLTATSSLGEWTEFAFSLPAE
jgi:two-component system, sensor histidine kinase PhcS